MMTGYRAVPISWRSVDLTSGLLFDRQNINREITIPIEFEQFGKTGRFAAYDMNWKPGDWYTPHHHWDSELGKLIEAAAYSLAKQPNPEWEAAVDDIVDKIGQAQQPDGYFNVYYLQVKPGKRFTNLFFMHELYCAGHMIEGAVAYHQATGKRKLLDIMCRYADLLCREFGRGEGRRRGFDGHPEIELALIKLFQATGNRAYLELCGYYVNERGTQPQFFAEEKRRREQTGDIMPKDGISRHEIDFLKSRGPYAIYQSHKPLREQDEPVGHAVRATYLYCGMTDLAAETGDADLMAACKRIWDATTEKYMSITGGVGASASGERFSFAYDLPNENTYNETCAAIGMAMWTHRLLCVTGEGRYADVLEQIVYNTILASVSRSGDRFFYANYLSVYPPNFDHADSTVSDSKRSERQEWFGTACCPPNAARFIASIGGYMYGQDENDLYVHLYATGDTRLTVGGTAVALSVSTDYPWDGQVKLVVAPDAPAEFGLKLHLPAWSDVLSLTINGNKAETIETNKGYICLKRVWSPGDEVNLNLSVPVRLMEAHPSVRQNAGRVAVMRGPLVYCFEEVDNGRDLAGAAIDPSARIREVQTEGCLGRAVLLELSGERPARADWESTLYREARLRCESAAYKAVPYFLWQNRGKGEMVVWVRVK